MPKELEALNKLAKQIELDEDTDFWEIKNAHKTVEQALLELQAIKEAKPSEALECLKKLKGMELSSMPFSDEYGTQEVDLNDIRKVGSQLNTDFREYTDTIKQTLLKAEKLEKAWEVVDEKGVDVGYLKTCETLEEYNSSCWNDEEDWNKKITQEEFELVKEMVK